jgi:hypothetical protein
MGSGTVQESPAGSTRLVDYILSKYLIVIAVIGILVADHFQYPGPAPAQANHLVPFADGPNRDGADRGIQSRDIAAAGQYSDYAFFCVYIRHGLTPYPVSFVFICLKSRPI